ncbi:dihydrofolate reductase [Terribacillus saccharophilus]|uniref:Dihydrofolate reductase n=1 Tax=Terribacillus saccharophilus TaxID=361277 RepID=A0ABX4H1S8_9BACI|nr:dihydrofolate reductase [Terribacillus saccharophilus]PAD36719.1 dihydrofolate reductase [Terribacillus saccharophilus]PAD97701.1 dihydrofolate reductase [Terribacillus saccharophilus]PAE01083.1 dihydrofolate reductase [Terribacillus saccharophilus]
MISLLFAMDQNRGIGYENDLPWRLPRDLRFFKEKTTGQIIVMGRKTLDSMNGALPNRTNVVLTRDKAFKADGVTILHDVNAVKELADEHSEKEIFIIGGSEIFSQTLEIADRIYMTYIEESFPADTYFPDFPLNKWQETSREKGVKDERNPYDYYFIQYDRLGH